MARVPSAEVWLAVRVKARVERPQASERRATTWRRGKGKGEDEREWG
jgi:hypothetical protein